MGQHDPGGNGLRSGIDRQDRGLLSVGARALDPHRVATGEAEDVIDCHRLRRAVGGRCRPRRSNASRSGGPSSPPNTGCRGRTGQASPRPGPLVARQINADGGGRFAAQNRAVTDETHVALVGHPRSTRRSSPGSRSLRQLGRCRDRHTGCRRIVERGRRGATVKPETGSCGGVEDPERLKASTIVTGDQTWVRLSYPASSEVLYT